MNKDDYLWDKTGSDPEIEKLENALAVFRYKEIAPPELPAKVLPFVKKEDAPPRSFVRFAYAAAACIAFAALALGLWLQISGPRSEVAQTPAAIPAETAAPEIADQTLEVVPVEATEKPDIKFTRRTLKPRVVKIQKPVRQAKAPARRQKIQNETMALSKEEKYAYEQLMLALSITGSKLRLVSDKIDGKTVDRDGR